MTVNDILAKLYEVNKIIDTLEGTYVCQLMVEHHTGEDTIDVENLTNILEDYKAMLGNMKVKE